MTAARIRAPAWLFVVAAAFVGYATLLIYGDLTRPDPPGFSARFENSRPVIGDVRPESAAARAGLRPSDEVLAVNDRVITTRWDWSALEVNMEYGRPWRFALMRAGSRVEAVLNFERTGFGNLRTRDGQVLFGVRLVLVVTLILALVVAFRRPRDLVALQGAWLLASVGVFSVGWPYRTAAIWRELPAVAGLPLWLPLVGTWAIGALFFLFFSSFPHRRARSGWYWALAFAPVVVAMATYAPSPASMVYAPDRTAPFSSTPFAILLAVNVGYVVAGLLMLAGTYRRLVDVNERRRVRVLAVGSAVGLAAGIPVVILFRLAGRDLTQPLFASGGVAVSALVFLVFPLSFVYAILRHRLFDVRVIIRSGVRYALARRALVSIVPALAVVLLLDVLVHGDQPLMSVIRARGAFYLVIAIAAIVAHRQRRGWLDALDRRYFRERYDARQLVGRLVADIRHVGSVDLVAPRAVAQLDAALHPSSVTLYVRKPGDAEFHALAGVPPERAATPLSSDLMLVRVMRVLGRPVACGAGSTWLEQQLPDTELDLLRRERIELIAPVALGPDRIEALLALGVKRSEEPYGREDLDLISAIAESLAPLLDHPRGSGTEADAFGECPDCGTCYDTGTVACRHEHARLAITHLPRVLASRYRLERRLGRGGMGTVYAATDMALERAVAAKVIREELAGSTDAALRFQQEARLAARFTHPHVVTVHDFGVTAGRVGFLVMELLEGRTLRAELNGNGPMAPTRAVGLLRGIASAVDAAHRLQLIHRDLKPENIFLVGSGADERAKVLDFGIAKSLSADVSHETVPGVLIGTPLYMAPEQLRGYPPSRLWDLWALAVIAFEMLTGDHPFADINVGAAPAGPAGYEELIAARLTGSAARAGAIFARALAIDPAQRPQTAVELISTFGDLEI
jgi:hypothetical protein